jgi:hypothetical protein
MRVTVLGEEGRQVFLGYICMLPYYEKKGAKFVVLYIHSG